MRKQDRVNLDKVSLRQQGYKRIKLVHLFDYYNDIEKCVTVYKARLKGQNYFKYFFPNELNPNVIWEKIKPDNVLSYHEDFIETGIIYNALVEKEDTKVIKLIKYYPLTGEIDETEVTFDG